MKTKRSAFNLIELTLAIAVVGIGIASIMALFVPAIDSTKNSIADNYAPDVVNTFVTYLLSTVKQNGAWDKITSSDPLFYGNIIENDANLDELVKKLAEEEIDQMIDWHSVSNFNGLYTTGTNGVFGIKTEGGEFTGILCVWRQKIMDFYNPEKDAIESIDTSKAIRICFELSWPAGSPYESRERRLYTIDIFNNNLP